MNIFNSIFSFLGGRNDDSIFSGFPMEDVVSYRDAEGKEYIWTNIMPHRNPLYYGLRLIAEDVEFEEIKE